MSAATTLPAPPDSDDRWIDFQIKRLDRVEKLKAAAKATLKLARRFADESKADGVAARDDHRVIDCLRQFREYRRAIARLKAMKCEDVDSVVLVALSADFSEET